MNDAVSIATYCVICSHLSLCTARLWRWVLRTVSTIWLMD